MDQFRVMKMFRRVVELSSFSAAADDLDIDGATMSRQIAQLEANLGTKLLVRTTRNISPTTAGEIFYEGSVRTLDLHDETQMRVLNLSEVPQGVLRVNAPMSFGIIHIAPLIPKFKMKYPDVEIDLDLNDQVVDIVGKNFDVAIRIRTKLADSSLMRKSLAHIRQTFVAAPSYIEKHGNPEKPEDLAKHNCIEYTLSTSPRAHWAVSDDDNTQTDVTGDFRVNNSLAMLPALTDGIGIGLMPWFTVKSEVEKGALVELLPKHCPPPHILCLIHGQGQLQSAALVKFKKFLEFEMHQLERAGAL